MRKSIRTGCDRASLAWADFFCSTWLSPFRRRRRGQRGSPRPTARSPSRPRTLSGIATALEFSSTDANLIIGVDLPHLTNDFLKYLHSPWKTPASRGQLAGLSPLFHYPLFGMPHPSNNPEQLVPSQVRRTTAGLLRVSYSTSSKGDKIAKRTYRFASGATGAGKNKSLE